MLTVLQASFRRLVNREGQTLAEVEAHTDLAGNPELLAYFRDGPRGYQLVQVVANDASTQIDWYDNNLHEAYEDVTMRMFSGPSHAAVHDRTAFAQQVLGMDGITEELNRHFGNNGSANDSRS
jgi:hypothetical protein